MKSTARAIPRPPFDWIELPHTALKAGTIPARMAAAWGRSLAAATWARVPPWAARFPLGARKPGPEYLLLPTQKLSPQRQQPPVALVVDESKRGPGEVDGHRGTGIDLAQKNKRIRGHIKDDEYPNRHGQHE